MTSDEEALQSEHGVDLSKRFVTQFVVVERVLALKFHGSQAHAEPRVELVELFSVGSKRRAEVLRDASDNAVEAVDHIKIEIMFSDGESSDVVLEFLQRLRPDVARTRREDEPEEGVTLLVGGDPRFLGA